MQKSISSRANLYRSNIRSLILYVGNNSLITYSVKPSSQFGVNQYIDETGRPHLQLVVKKNLGEFNKIQLTTFFN